MKYMEWTSLPAMFFDSAAKHKDRPFLWAKKSGSYKGRSYGKSAEQVSLLARGLEDCGIGFGDRVVLVSENRPEWVIADFAIMASGAISVPAYITNTAEDHLHILTNVTARAAIVSTARLLPPLLEAARKSGSVNIIITMEATYQTGGHSLHHPHIRNRWCAERGHAQPRIDPVQLSRCL